jgi:hypothetical protein
MNTGDFLSFCIYKYRMSTPKTQGKQSGVKNKKGAQNVHRTENPQFNTDETKKGQEQA